jgi:DNA-directed RNA polymerase beta subunit
LDPYPASSRRLLESSGTLIDRMRPVCGLTARRRVALLGPGAVRTFRVTLDQRAVRACLGCLGCPCGVA